MKSKASYFSFSIPLVKENLRRFWAIPVISFLVYFLSGVFPILMSYNKINDLANYIEMSLHNIQPFYMGAHLLIPVITAVVLFRYLQSASSVAVMHSLPFTRSKLFNSNFVTGILLTVVPMLLNGIILLLLSKPTYQQWGYGSDMSINWIWTSLLIILVIYSVSVFSGIITGNTFIHLMASFFFAFLITVLYAVFNVYCEYFLYGFSSSGNWTDVCLAISPFTGILNNQGYFSTIAVWYYIGTFLFMYFISLFLYNKRKLERATDSLVFAFMKPIICYIITFLGMTLLGFYFDVLGDGSNFYIYTGFAAGTIIFFIIGQMIVTKSTRIFNKEGLRNFLIYGVIAFLFIVSLNVDATGFERRVPNPENVKSGTLTNNFYSGHSPYWYDKEKNQLKTAENIQALTAFHKSVLENRSRFEQKDAKRYTNSIYLSYDTGGLLNMNRDYRVDYDFIANNTYLAQIFESLEYKMMNSLYGMGVEDYKEIQLYTDYYIDDDNPVINKPNELIACMEKDFRAMTYKEKISLKQKYATAEITYTYQGENVVGNKLEKGDLRFEITRTCSNTISWLKDHGYSLGLTADQVEYVDIFKNIDEAVPHDDRYANDKVYSEKQQTPLLRITDKDTIEKILNQYDVQQTNFEDGYNITIKYRTNASDPSNVGYELIYGYLNDGINFLDLK